LGSVAWVISMVLGGYYLEAWIVKQFGISLTSYIEMITIAIILITTIPIMYKLFFAKKHVVPHSDNDPDAVL
jgi:membrane-associated protein